MVVPVDTSKGINHKRTVVNVAFTGSIPSIKFYGNVK
jgi:hypothetical protein